MSSAERVKIIVVTRTLGTMTSMFGIIMRTRRIACGSRRDIGNTMISTGSTREIGKIIGIGATIILTHS
jgi:hypothetical protein